MFYIPTDEAVSMIVFIDIIITHTHTHTHTQKGDEESAQFEATLSCEGLDVEGSRHQRFKVTPNTWIIEFNTKQQFTPSWHAKESQHTSVLSIAYHQIL